MPNKIGVIAPSPDWATDGVILAVRDQGSYKQDLMRTRDGGQSWQRLPVPRSDATRLSSWFVQGPGGRIVFYLAGVSSKGNLSLDYTLFRSADDGETWEDVAHERVHRTTLSLSPTFTSDGLAYMLMDGRLLRSTDAGKSWDQVTLAGPKGIDAIAFSPGFVTDRTIVASVAAAGMNGLPIVRPGTNEPDTEAGLLTSSDGGASWSPIAAPSHEGTAYPRVTQIALSPAFGEDGTLFVEAVDRWRDPSRTVTPRAAIFRSTDRGLTWTMVAPVLAPEPILASGSRSGHLALSPTFADDQTVLLANRIEGDAERPRGRCVVQRSRDAGATWSERQTVVLAEHCVPLAIWQGPDGPVTVSAGSISYDLGETWQPLTVPDGSELTEVRPSPAFKEDGTLFLGLSRGGVMLLGNGARSASGRIGCDVAPAEQLARVHDADPWTWDWLGCPTSPARPVTFTERLSNVDGVPSRSLWLNAVDMRYRFPTSPGLVLWYGDLVTPLPQTPHRVVQGVSQVFEQGQAFILPTEDGAQTELIFVGGGHYFGGQFRVVKDPE